MMVFMAANWQAQSTRLNVVKWKLANSGMADMRSKRSKDSRPKNTFHTLRLFTVQILYSKFYRRTELPLIYVPQPVNPLTPNDPYSGPTAPLTSKLFILYIYSTNTGTEYFKHGVYSPFFLFKMQFVS